MSDELKLPLHFNCPNCKNDKGILQEVSKKELAEGTLPKDVPVATGCHNILMADEGDIRSGKLSGKTVRRLFYYADICSKCGAQYIYMVEIKNYLMPAGAPHGQAPRIILPDMGQPPPGFGKRN